MPPARSNSSPSNIAAAFKLGPYARSEHVANLIQAAVRNACTNAHAVRISRFAAHAPFSFSVNTIYNTVLPFKYNGRPHSRPHTRLKLTRKPPAHSANPMYYSHSFKAINNT